MRKIIFTVFALLVMLISNTSLAQAGSAIELISVTNNGGGPTFTFRVNGDFSKDDLKGSGQISGGDDFVLNCKVEEDDPTLVICHAPQKAGGKSVSITFGGATFWTDVPEQRIVSSRQYCYQGWANQYFNNADLNYNPIKNSYTIIFQAPVIEPGVQEHSICYDEKPEQPTPYVQVTYGNLENVLEYSNTGKDICAIANQGEGYYPVACVR